MCVYLRRSGNNILEYRMCQQRGERERLTLDADG
jgi:hypothetical protein